MELLVGGQPKETPCNTLVNPLHPQRGGGGGGGGGDQQPDGQRPEVPLPRPY